jgi:transposase
VPESPSPAPEADELAARLATVTSERDTFKDERDQYKRLYLEMMTLCRKLELGIIGRGRERDLGDANQVSMSLLGLMTGVAPAAKVEPEKPPEPPRERAKPTGRKPLPAKLPRVDITVLPPEVQKAGTDAFEQIGEDVTETVERRPGSLVVVRVHKPKFVEKHRDLKREVQVLQAAPPELPIERGLAGPALLADTLVKRWEDHLPLHRQERIYGRDGLELSRSTICQWHLDLAQLVKPLLEVMWQDAFKAPYLCVDATGVLVQNIEKCRNAHFFVVAAPERHVLFGYSPKHNKAAVDALLDGFKGWLVLDAHIVYEHLFLDGTVIEVGCWSHARRYFYKALGSEPERSRIALTHIKKLFEVERSFKAAPPEVRLPARLRDSKPVLDAFEKWCDEESMRVLDETPLSKAIGYARNQRQALRRFLEDGRLPLTNNWSERELRREALGRNAWLFVGSDEGGEANATFVSLIASCQLHGLKAYEYLRDMLILLPSWNVQKVLELSPMKWKQTMEREEVKAVLAANIYRRASLGELT